MTNIPKLFTFKSLSTLEKLVKKWIDNYSFINLDNCNCFTSQNTIRVTLIIDFLELSITSDEAMKLFISNYCLFYNSVKKIATKIINEYMKSDKINIQNYESKSKIESRQHIFIGLYISNFFIIDNVLNNYLIKEILKNNTVFALNDCLVTNISKVKPFLYFRKYFKACNCNISYNQQEINDETQLFSSERSLEVYFNINYANQYINRKCFNCNKEFLVDKFLDTYINCQVVELIHFREEKKFDMDINYENDSSFIERFKTLNLSSQVKIKQVINKKIKEQDTNLGFLKINLILYDNYVGKIKKNQIISFVGYLPTRIYNGNHDSYNLNSNFSLSLNGVVALNINKSKSSISNKILKYSFNEKIDKLINSNVNKQNTYQNNIKTKYMTQERIWRNINENKQDTIDKYLSSSHKDSGLNSSVKNISLDYFLKKLFNDEYPTFIGNKISIFLNNFLCKCLSNIIKDNYNCDNLNNLLVEMSKKIRLLLLIEVSIISLDYNLNNIIKNSEYKFDDQIDANLADYDHLLFKKINKNYKKNEEIGKELSENKDKLRLLSFLRSNTLVFRSKLLDEEHKKDIENLNEIKIDNEIKNYCESAKYVSQLNVNNTIHSDCPTVIKSNVCNLRNNLNILNYKIPNIMNKDIKIENIGDTQTKNKDILENSKFEKNSCNIIILLDSIDYNCGSFKILFEYYTGKSRTSNNLLKEKISLYEKYVGLNTNKNQVKKHFLDFIFKNQNRIVLIENIEELLKYEQELILDTITLTKNQNDTNNLKNEYLYHLNNALFSKFSLRIQFIIFSNFTNFNNNFKKKNERDLNFKDLKDFSVNNVKKIYFPYNHLLSVCDYVLNYEANTSENKWNLFDNLKLSNLNLNIQSLSKLMQIENNELSKNDKIYLKKKKKSKNFDNFRESTDKMKNIDLISFFICNSLNVEERNMFKKWFLQFLIHSFNIINISVDDSIIEELIELQNLKELMALNDNNNNNNNSDQNKNENNNNSTIMTSNIITLKNVIENLKSHNSKHKNYDENKVSNKILEKYVMYKSKEGNGNFNSFSEQSILDIWKLSENLCYLRQYNHSSDILLDLKIEDVMLAISIYEENMCNKFNLVNSNCFKLFYENKNFSEIFNNHQISSLISNNSMKINEVYYKKAFLENELLKKMMFSLFDNFLSKFYPSLNARKNFSFMSSYESFNEFICQNVSLIFY